MGIKINYNQIVNWVFTFLGPYTDESAEWVAGSEVLPPTGQQFPRATCRLAGLGNEGTRGKEGNAEKEEGQTGERSHIIERRERAGCKRALSTVVSHSLLLRIRSQQRMPENDFP